MTELSSTSEDQSFTIDDLSSEIIQSENQPKILFDQSV